MKCVNCNTQISPNLVVAIVENRCPACGQQLMDGSEYQKLMALRKQLTPLGLGLDDSALTRVAAAITSKFDLWPRAASEDSGEPASPPMPEVPMQAPTPPQEPNVRPKAPKPIRPKNQHEAEKVVQSRLPGVSFDEDDIPVSLYEEGFDGSDSPPSEAADIIREFGLDKGDMASMVAMDTGKVRQNNPFIDMMSEIPLEGSMPVPGSADDRLERAKALQGTANMYGIKPMTGRRRE